MNINHEEIFRFLKRGTERQKNRDIQGILANSGCVSDRTRDSNAHSSPECGITNVEDVLSESTRRSNKVLHYSQCNFRQYNFKLSVNNVFQKKKNWSFKKEHAWFAISAERFLQSIAVSLSVRRVAFEQLQRMSDSGAPLAVQRSEKFCVFAGSSSSLSSEMNVPFRLYSSVGTLWSAAVEYW